MAFSSKKPFKRKPPCEELGLSGIKRGKLFLLYTTIFKEFIREHKGILSRFSKLFREKEKEIRRGEPVKEGNIRIQREATGDYKGIAIHSLPLKVTVGRKEFFVKITVARKAEEIAEKFRAVERFLKKKAYKTEGFNVRLIKPYLLLEKNSSRAYVVTDFYHEKEVIQVLGMSGKKGERIKKAVKNMYHKAGRKFDIDTHNAFYHEKTNTILLYDL
ncbi:hypothetical protein KJ660_01555 [Candidatus Micrarchaeota archaeon]|nr:hypothetical protein [Candidatus Micrarchaeota archaeon]